MSIDEPNSKRIKDSLQALKISPLLNFWIGVLIYSLLFVQCQSRETVLLSSFTTKNDHILFRILQETNYMLKSHRNINHQNFVCFSILKNELVQNQQSTYNFFNYSLDYHETLFLEGQYKGKQFDDGSIRILYHKLDQLLNLLQGQCLYYRTTTFITEYCHKQHIRQFDDDYTKYYNQKSAYEDFTLGIFDGDMQSYLMKRSIENKSTLSPGRSDFSEKYRHMFVGSISSSIYDLQLEQNEDGKVVHFNNPIVQNSSYLEHSPVFIQIICIKNETGQFVFNVGLVVNPFEAIYTKKEGKCDEYYELNFLSSKIKYEQADDLRIYKKFLYGKVEDECTKKWNWERKGKDFQYAELMQGSTLFIEFHNSVSNSIKHQYVTVKKVYHSQLVQLQEHLTVSFIPNQENLFNKVGKMNSISSHVTRCELLFNKPLVKSHKTSNNLYLHSNLMILNTTILGNQDKIGCICELDNHKQFHVIDMEIEVGHNIWTNFYQVYLQTHQDIYDYPRFKDVLFKQCSNITCFNFGQKLTNQPQQSNYGFTSLAKINHRFSIYNITENQSNHIFVLNINKGGVIRLITVDSYGNQYVYILSEGQLLKIRQFQNGTKEIQKQNKIYQNITRSSDQTMKNYIYIHCEKLPNGTLYGGIWKSNDYLYFPRLRILNQTLISFQYRAGYAYIRTLNPSKMKKAQFLPILKYPHYISNQYLDNEQSQQKQKSLLLNESYSINYTYKGGDFCGDNINKDRQTLVTIRCGQSWFQITQVHETQPCTYWIGVESLLMCQENFKTVVESDDQIPNKIETDRVIFSGVMCIKEFQMFNEQRSLIYLGKKMVNEQ